VTALTSPIDFPTPLSASTIADTRAPAAVRENAPGARQAYARAQSFEGLLVDQLSQSLMQSSGVTGEGEGENGEAGAGEGDGGGGMVASLLPQTLTEGVMRAGGLGLAAQLMNAVDPRLGTGSGAVSTSSGGAESYGATTDGITAVVPVSAGGGSAYAPAGSLAATGGASA
jgi:hypothetical protein